MLRNEGLVSSYGIINSKMLESESKPKRVTFRVWSYPCSNHKSVDQFVCKAHFDFWL